jgi:biotin transporter BioY
MSCIGIHKIRSYRLINIALFDVIATLLVSVILSRFIKGSWNNKHMFFTFIIMMVIGILVHAIMGIPTMLNYYLGINIKKNVLEKRVC